MLGEVGATGDSVGQAVRFAETPWSVVIAAARTSTPRADAALAELCRIYWPCIYAHLRRRGYDIADAQDLTQSFFQHLLENQTLRRAARAKGRFRSFLVGALKLSVTQEYRRAHALKRGGAVEFISLDEFKSEEIHHQHLAPSLSADELLDARWARVLLDGVMAAVRAEFSEGGKAATFDALAPFLGGAKGEVSYAEAAESLGLSVAAVRMMIHRLRRQFATAVRREIMRTVSAPHEVDDELRRLRAAFARVREQQAA
jgi:RNA polymerase sigma-70 factor (ECF subfamily)